MDEVRTPYGVATVMVDYTYHLLRLKVKGEDGKE
jgi:hypothetical protein